MQWLKKNGGYIAVVLAAVLVLTAVAIIALPEQSNGPVSDPQPADGPETGIYYYETKEGEYLLSLNSGNSFTIAGPSLNKSGKYAVTENGIELDFIRDEDGIGSIVTEGDVLTLQYKDTTMRFLKKVTYAVTFNANGGSEVAAVDVVNGKTVAKPADPVKAGSVF
ncbi:MAG: hypothetical protein E7438_02050, partial [Ruminococcaceae bacterium]|nr:hypothetical protein [Oscillospiraceae bacterium]